MYSYRLQSKTSPKCLVLFCFILFYFILPGKNYFLISDKYHMIFIGEFVVLLKSKLENCSSAFTVLFEGV